MGAIFGWIGGDCILFSMETTNIKISNKVIFYVYIYMKYVSATGGKHFKIQFWHLAAAIEIHEPQYIVNPPAKENNYIVKHISAVSPDPRDL